MRNRYEALRNGTGGVVRDETTFTEIAECQDLRDAVKIADALNAAEERRQVTTKREAELARRL